MRSNRMMWAGVALLSVTLVGCGAGRRAQARGSTLAAFEILDAQKMATQIEQWRVHRIWSQINANLSAVAYTPAQRQMEPSYPFSTSSKPLGDLQSFQLFSSIEDPDYRDPKTGTTYQMAAILFHDSNALIAQPVRTKLTMIKENGVWKLAGVVSAIQERS